MKTKLTGNLCLTVLFLMLTKLGAFGQTCITPQARIYANSQQINAGLLTSSNHEGDAADGNPKTSSTLNIPLGVGELITITQFIKFDNSIIPIAKNTPVTVKVSLPKGLLSLLGGVEIRAFKDLHFQPGPLGLGGDWRATGVGPALTGTTLLGLLNGAGDSEITITPTADDYDGVWVRMSGIAVLQSINVFDAYIQKDAIGTIGCNTLIDVMAGVRAGTVVGGIANVTGSVTDRYAAIDGSTSTAAILNVGVQALSLIYHTTIFNTESQPKDYVRMLIEDSDGGLLTLAALSSFRIQLYKGNTPVGSAIDNSSGLLSLSLFPGSTTKQYINIKPPGNSTFDRIEVQIGGLASASLFGTGLKIYDVKRVIGAPVTDIDGITDTAKTVCPDNTAALTVNSPLSCNTYKWYKTPTGGTSFYTGTSYTPPVSDLLPAASYDYYIEAIRAGCTEISDRSKVTITVKPRPSITPGPNPIVCSGKTSVLLPYTAPTNTPTTYSITWDGTAVAQGFGNVPDTALPADEITLAVPEHATPATYNGTILVKNADGCISSNTPVSLKVDALPVSPVINLTN